MIEPSVFPSSKENSMVPVSFAFLLSKSWILFLSLFITAFSSLPLKLALKLTSSNSILTSNTFTAAQIWNSLSLVLYHSSSSPCLQISLCVCVSGCTCALYWHCVCVIRGGRGGGGTCDLVCMFLPYLVWKCLLIFICCVRLYTTDLYHYRYLCIVCFSLSCKVLWVSKSTL